MRVQWCFAGVLLLCSVAWATEPLTRLQGRVIHVEDGDSVVLLLRDYSKIKVRLSDIDAPESARGKSRPGQPFSRNSKESLSQLVLGEAVSADCYETDRYRRQVCRIFFNGADVNAEQVRRGWAWANRAQKRYVRDPKFFGLEDDARARRRGLWAATQQPVAPWEWRKACWKKGECDEDEQ